MNKNGSIIFVRAIEDKDYSSMGKVWRDVFGRLEVTDESVVETFEKMEIDGRYHTFVADMDGHIVGLVTTVESLAINLPNGYIKINALGVLPDFQHCGIGRKLIERVEKLARERNVPLIGLASGFQRADAHNFYEHLGYKKSSFWFSKRI